MLLSHKKEWIFVNSMDGPKGYYAQWNSQRKTNIVWFHLHASCFLTATCQVLVLSSGETVVNKTCGLSRALGEGKKCREPHLQARMLKISRVCLFVFAFLWISCIKLCNLFLSLGLIWSFSNFSFSNSFIYFP